VLYLNPFLGTRFKAGAVTTDLPLLPDKPIDFGLQIFAENARNASGCLEGISTGER